MRILLFQPPEGINHHNKTVISFLNYFSCFIDKIIICAQVHVHGYVHVCVYVCVYAAMCKNGSHSSKFSIFLCRVPSHFFLRQSLSLNLAFIPWLNCMTTSPRVLLFLSPRRWNFKCTLPHLACFAWKSNSGPYAYKASTLLNRSAPQPW